MTDKPEISLLITDLDNTLFDWVRQWYESFAAMMGELHRQSGVGMETLLAEAQSIHQKYKTSEYAFLIEEMPSLREKHSGCDLREVYAGAIDAYREARRSHLRLYPGVLDTLQEVRRHGCLIVGYTESMRFYTLRRAKNLQLDGLLDLLYVQNEHDLPQDLDVEKIRKYAPEAYELQHTLLRETPRGEVKPNPDILLAIVSEVGGDPSKTAYVGDNRAKDVRMAQQAGIIDVHAKYGEAHEQEEYDLLKRVTHWTSEQVSTEQTNEVSPRYALKSFSELLTFFQFVSYAGSVRAIP